MNIAFLKINIIKDTLKYLIYYNILVTEQKVVYYYKRVIINNCGVITKGIKLGNVVHLFV